MNPTLRRSSELLVAIVAVALLAAGCGGSSGAPLAAPTTAAGAGSGPLVVHIKNYAYLPPTLEVKPGEKITFVNDDSVDHTATANDKSFDTGTIAAGTSKTITVKAGTSGKDGYFCTVHNYMKGALDVTS